MLTTTKNNDNSYDVRFGDATLGKFIRDVDGYFYFLPIFVHGTWAGWTLKCLAEELDRLNKPWDRQIERYFRREKRKEFWRKVAERVKRWFKR